MSKLNQKIVLFIEPAEEEWSKPSKMGSLFMNRFAIDENANHEILKIYHLENIFLQSFLPSKRSVEGLDLINYTVISYDS